MCESWRAVVPTCAYVGKGEECEYLARAVEIGECYYKTSDSTCMADKAWTYNQLPREAEPSQWEGERGRDVCVVGECMCVQFPVISRPNENKKMRKNVNCKKVVFENQTLTSM